MTKNNNNKTWKKLLTVVIVLIIFAIIMTQILYFAAPSLFNKSITKIEFTENTTYINSDEEYNEFVKKQATPRKYADYKEVKKDQQDIVDVSRQPLVKVDVGFDSIEETLPEGVTYNGTTNISREYWSYTNKYSQIEFVHADKVIPQDEGLEKDWMLGGHRYSPSQAAVEGLNEGKDYYGDYTDPTKFHLQSRLDSGHSLADSLGGNSTSYNITPQASSLNQDYPGPWRNMEMEISRNHGAEYFNERILYANRGDNIPEKYKVSYITTNSKGQRMYKEYTVSNINNYDTFWNK